MSFIWDRFREGYNCAQVVFSSGCEELDLERDTALKIACGFGGGMGRKQEVCGAVTGGILVLGLRHGRGEKDELPARDTTYRKTRELMDRFGRKHGSWICRRLLDGCDLSTEEGKKFFKEKEQLKKICIPCVESVLEILDDMRQAGN